MFMVILLVLALLRGERRWHCTSLQELRSEEHTSELQSHLNLVCRLLLEKKKPPPSPVRPSPRTCRQEPTQRASAGSRSSASAHTNHSRPGSSGHTSWPRRHSFTPTHRTP